MIPTCAQGKSRVWFLEFQHRLTSTQQLSCPSRSAIDMSSTDLRTHSDDVGAVDTRRHLVAGTFNRRLCPKACWNLALLTPQEPQCEACGTTVRSILGDMSLVGNAICGSAHSSAAASAAMVSVYARSASLALPREARQEEAIS